VVEALPLRSSSGRASVDLAAGYDLFRLMRTVFALTVMLVTPVSRSL
jgi:hypothetical protein